MTLFKYLICFLFIFFKCNDDKANESELLTDKSIGSCKKIEIPLNTEVENSFGYKYISDMDIIQPNGLAISDNWIFIFDTFNRHIKKINLIDGKIKSFKVDDSYGNIVDMIIFRERLICASDSGYLINFDNNLNIKDSKKLVDDGNGKFHFVNEDHFEVIFPSINGTKLFRIRSNNEILSIENKIPSFKNKIHGKFINILNNGNTIQTKFKTFELEHEYDIRRYSGRNLEFNTDKIVYYFVSEDKRKLEIYFCE